MKKRISLVKAQSASKTVDILNVNIDNISRAELLENIRDGGVVFTPNVDHIMKLQSDEEFARAYSAADYRVCDSQILMGASRLLKKPIREKISGSDFLRDFYRHYSSDESVNIFLLGGAEGVAETAKNCINEKTGRNIVVQAHSPSFGFEKDEKENGEIVDLINDSGATVLAIGVGAPKQEKWIFQHRDKLKNVRIILAIGATIDFEAGHIQRAPLWVSDLGLEWLYRLIQEPQRLWKRYLVDDTVFVWLVAREILSAWWRRLLSQRTDRPFAKQADLATTQKNKML